MFEVVTKERVFKLVAPSQADMVAWVKSLAPATSLHHENGLFFQAENLIQHSAKQRAMLREKELLRHFHEAHGAMPITSTSAAAVSSPSSPGTATEH
jgi:hypothetical protein